MRPPISAGGKTDWSWCCGRCDAILWGRRPEGWPPYGPFTVGRAVLCPPRGVAYFRVIVGADACIDPYDFAEKLLLVGHVLALGVVNDRGVGGGLGGFGFVQGVTDGGHGSVGGSGRHAVQRAQLHGSIQNAT